MATADRQSLVAVSARVTPELRRRLEAVAAAEDRPLSHVVRRALQAALAAKAQAQHSNAQGGMRQCQ